MNSPVLAPLLQGNTLGTANGLVIAEWEDPGGLTSKDYPVAPLHLHRHDDEIWYVLEGTLHVQIGKNEIQAQVGAAVIAPRGTPHTYWNPYPARSRYLLFMTANTHRLIQAIHATDDRTKGALRALFEQYDSELL